MEIRKYQDVMDALGLVLMLRKKIIKRGIVNHAIIKDRFKSLRI